MKENSVDLFEKFNVGGGRSYDPINLDQYEANVELTDEEKKKNEYTGGSVDIAADNKGTQVGAKTTEVGDNTDAGTPGGGDNQASKVTNIEKNEVKQAKIDTNKSNNSNHK